MVVFGLIGDANELMREGEVPFDHALQLGNVDGGILRSYINADDRDYN